MGVQIFTDSSCDLPKEILTENNIHVIPLHVTFKDKTYLDRVDLEVKEFYQKMKEQEELPKTAAPSPYDYLHCLEKNMKENDEGIVISLSSQLSSTYHNAKTAVEMYKENNPNTKIEAIDSKNASVGLGLIVQYAASLIEEGLEYKTLLQRIKEKVDQTTTLIFLDTLENVIKGGRLDKVKGKIASVLSIKILMKNSIEGSLEIIDKVRGSKKAMLRLIELFEEYGGNLEEKILGLAHSNCEEKALILKETIEKKFKQVRVVLTEIGPTIGTYAGEGGILVSLH